MASRTETMDEHYWLAGMLLCSGHPATMQELSAELRRRPTFLRLVKKYRRVERNRLRNIREKRRLQS